MNNMFLYKYSSEDLENAIKACNANLDDSLNLVQTFESKYSEYQRVKYVLACCNGTSAMLEALWACGVGEGTEIIAPAMTYWASAFQAFSLGAKIKYADIDPVTLCIDPQKIEDEITPNTKAIVAVHLYGHPCDMKAIMRIARKHGIYVIEDFSHAHGALCDGVMCGSIGDIGVASCMREKAFPLVEGGVICTNNESLYERCCAFGHYRYLGCIENGNQAKKNIVSDENLFRFAGTSIGAIKNRMNPVSAALGISILETFEKHVNEVLDANNYFMDLLDETGIYKGHRVKKDNWTMGGWYMPKLFVPKDYARNIAENIRQNGVDCYVGHKYYLLPGHFYNQYCNAFSATKRLFSKDGSSEFANEIDVSKYENAIESNKCLLSAPRFLINDKKEIEKYADIYVKAVCSVV